MYIKRLIENTFSWWKEHSECVLEVEGCRQVGKTTTILHFAENNYKNVIYVNCSTDTNKFLLERANFNNALECVKDFSERSSLTYSNDKDTVLILDEIQESKLLYERIRVFNRCLNCDVIVTGSYLYRAQSFFQSAGDVYKVRMYPISYEEYLLYFNYYNLYQEKSIEELCTDYWEELKQIYDVYLTVGGYPAVFKAYLNEESIDDIFEELLNVLKGELRSRAGRSADYDKIEQIFSSMCSIICNEKRGNKRVVDNLSKITEQEHSKRLSTKECNNLLAWLSASRVINYCNKVDLVTGENYDEERIYFEDIGLFNYLCNKYFVRKATVRGILAETFVYKYLSENNFRRRFYGDRPAFAVYRDCELDFCIRSKYDDALYGIEVKSRNGQSISVNKAFNDKKVDFVLFAKGESLFGNENKKYTIPIFLIGKFGFDKGEKVVKESLPRIAKRDSKNMSLF